MTPIQIRNLPEEIHKKFKVWCAANSVTMNAMLIALMDEVGNEEHDIILRRMPDGSVKLERIVLRRR